MAEKPQSWSPAGSSKICRADPGARLLVQDQQARTAGVRAGADLVVRGEIRRQRVRPRLGVEAGVRVQRAEVVPPPQRGQLHPPEQRVAHQHPERPLVAGHRRRPVGRQVRDLLDRVAQPLPLVDEAGVDLPDQLAQPLDQVRELLGPRLLRHRLAHRLVGVGQVAQDQALGPGQPVEADVLGEGHRPLVHVTRHRLGRQRVVGDPRMALPVDVVGGLQQVGLRPRVGDRLQQIHPLVVLDAFGLHRGHRLAARLEQLRGQHLARIVERGLDHRQHVERVLRRRPVQQLDGGQGERRQRLVEREVLLQVDRQPDPAARRRRARRSRSTTPPASSAR